MAIILEKEFLTDRMIDDVIYLPFEERDILLAANKRSNIIDYNTAINKLYTNLKFLYSYSKLYVPVLNDFNEVYTNTTTYNIDVKAVAVAHKTLTNEIITATAFEKYIVLKIHNRNTFAQTHSIVIDNIYAQNNGNTFRSIIDICFDGNHLYVLDSDNIFKIDLILCFQETSNSLMKAVLENVTQGYKDVLEISETGIKYEDKAGLTEKYKNEKITITTNYILVLDNTKNISRIKVFTKSLTLIKVINITMADTIIKDIDYQDGIINLLSKKTSTGPCKYLYFQETEIINDNISFIQSEFSPTCFFTGIKATHDNMLYVVGNGIINDNSARIYRTFKTKNNRVIDSKNVADETESILSMDIVSNSNIDIIIVASNRKVKMLKVSTPLVSCVEDFDIFNLADASVSGEEYHTFFTYNKSIYKVLTDNINFLINIKGQFNGQIISAKVGNGVPEIIYNGIRNKTNINIDDYNIDVDQHFIYSTEMFHHEIINRSFKKVLDIQRTILENIKSNLGNFSETGIEIG